MFKRATKSRKMIPYIPQEFYGKEFNVKQSERHFRLMRKEVQELKPDKGGNK